MEISNEQLNFDLCADSYHTLLNLCQYMMDGRDGNLGKNDLSGNQSGQDDDSNSDISDSSVYEDVLGIQFQ